MYLNYYNPVNLRLFMNQFNLRLICYFVLNVTGMYIFLFAPPPGEQKYELLLGLGGLNEEIRKKGREKGTKTLHYTIKI